MDARKLYELRLSKSARGTLLAQELELEDRYRDGVVSSLANLGMPEQLIEHDYLGWRAFSGGGENLLKAIECAAQAVANAATSTGAQVPPYYCGLWPDAALNASTLATSHGNVIYVNSALLVSLRCLTQEVANAFDEVLAESIGERSTQASAAIGAMLARHLSGVDIRIDYIGRVLVGPKELLRREMMWGALCYVIAHEAGHLARCRRWRGGWADDNAAFQIAARVDENGNLALPDDEFQATNAVSAEDIADDIATTIMREPPCCPVSGINPGFMLGAMSVPLLQAATWWRAAALTDKPLGWIHPLADLRAVGVGLSLGQTGAMRALLESADPTPAAVDSEPSPLEILAQRFRNWAEEVLAIDQCRSLVHKKGLGNRGLSPETLMTIFATDPDMPRQPSDVLARLKIQPPSG